MSYQVHVITDVNPEPWTAPSVSVGRKGGKVFPRVYKSSALKAYQEAIRESLDERGAVVTDEVSLQFYFWRELPSYETERDRKARKHEADATNLQKALEDALQGIIIENDRQVVGVESWVMEQSHGTKPLIVILVQPRPKRPELSPGLRQQVLDAQKDAVLEVPERRDFNPKDVF